MSTGDRDQESNIFFSEDEGMSWVPIGSGDQQFRAVSLLFTRDCVYWGSDAPTRQNYIYRFIRRSGEIQRLAAVNGPVHCSFMTENGILLFGTTAEGDSEGKSAAWDKKAHIWGSKDGLEWEDLVSWQKDRMPYELFGYGRIFFTSGYSRENNIHISPQAVKGYDNVVIHAKIMP
jgi:hypothetical protein